MTPSAALFSLFTACLSEPNAIENHPVRTPQREGKPASDMERTGAEVRFVYPQDGATVPNPVTFEFEGHGVSSLFLTAEEWQIARWSPALDGWTTTWDFSGTDTPRLMTIKGLDPSGRTVASAQIEFIASSGSQDPDEDSSAQGTAGEPRVLDVPYFYQYDNRNEPGATCGITSTAMVLSHWRSGSVTPDDLYWRYGKAQGQSPGGVAEIFRSEGLVATSTVSGSRRDIRRHVDAGRPVVVNGFWTASGHIAVIIGHDERGWIVHDPAGDWERCYGCGTGAAVRHAYGGGWDDRLSVDGDIWFATADTRVF